MRLIVAGWVMKPMTFMGGSAGMRAEVRLQLRHVGRQHREALGTRLDVAVAGRSRRLAADRLDDRLGELRRQGNTRSQMRGAKRARWRC